MAYQRKTRDVWWLWVNYGKYMAEAIDEFGDGTGFEISFD